jgi:hypothetical protein
MTCPLQETSRRVLRQAIPIVGLFAVVWLAYFPSLGHGPRADQWCYLLDTVGEHQFATLFAHTYSYNRTRMVCPGDYHLFRPVLFALLSGEKALFGNNFAWWQAIGILLHCLALYLLLRLMLRIQVLVSEDPSTEPAGRGRARQTIMRALSFALVLYFGLNCAVVEMVIWAHINGYLLFVVLVLGSILLLLEGITTREELRFTRTGLLGAVWVLTLLSAFTYEIGQFYALIAGTLAAAALYRKGAARRSVILFAVFFGILVIYRMANVLDQRAHAERAPDIDIATILQRMTSFITLTHTLRYLFYDLVQPFFPSWVSWSFTSRLVIPEAVASHWHDWKNSPVPIVSYALLGGMAGLTLIGLRRLLAGERKRVGVVAVLLAFSLIALHLAITVVGRMNVRPGPDVLSTNSYYPYLPLLFLILGIFGIWAFAAFGQSPAWWTRLGNGLAVLMIGSLLILSVVSGLKVHAINLRGRDDFAGFTRRVATVERLIREHGKEADFSLAFTFDSFQALGTQYGVPISTILFQRYFTASPKYVVSFPDGEPSLMTYEEWRASRGPANRLCPELVAVGSSYMCYRFEGKYYGVLHWDGCYDPLRRDHAYLIEGATLEEVRRQQQSKLDIQEADIRDGRFIPPGSSVALVEKGYKGFNLIESAGRVYAIPQGEGAFDPVKIREHGYSSSHVGGSLAEVKSRIDGTS